MPRIPRESHDDEAKDEKTRTVDTPEPGEPVGEVPSPVPPMAGDPVVESAAEEPVAAEQQDTSRVSVVNESQSEEEEEYQWHTGAQRPHGAEDAIEFVDVHKAFGRNKILRGLNMGLPEGKISMILGPSGTGKSVCIKHMVGLLYPDEGDVLVHGQSVPNLQDDELFG